VSTAEIEVRLRPATRYLINLNREQRGHRAVINSVQWSWI
jgi:hypothetical protein